MGSDSAWMLSMAVLCATSRCLLMLRDRLRLGPSAASESGSADSACCHTGAHAHA